MAWDLLFGSDSGLFSVFVIAFTIGMSVFFGVYFRKKMREDEQKARGR